MGSSEHEGKYKFKFFVSFIQILLTPNFNHIIKMSHLPDSKWEKRNGNGKVCVYYYVHQKDLSFSLFPTVSITYSQFSGFYFSFHISEKCAGTGKFIVKVF